MKIQLPDLIIIDEVESPVSWAKAYKVKQVVLGYEINPGDIIIVNEEQLKPHTIDHGELGECVLAVPSTAIRGKVIK